MEEMVDVDDYADTEPPSNPEEPDEEPDDVPGVMHEAPRTPPGVPPCGRTRNPSPKRMANPPIGIMSNETVVIPALAPASDLPRGYSWVDWNDPEALLQEAKLAEEHKIPLKLRGPCSPMHGGPDLWRDIPFNQATNSWLYKSRHQLPAS